MRKHNYVVGDSRNDDLIWDDSCNYAHLLTLEQAREEAKTFNVPIYKLVKVKAKAKGKK